jgi:hypothetical protein
VIEVEPNGDYIDKDYNSMNDITIYTKTIVFVNGRQWMFGKKV